MAGGTYWRAAVQTFGVYGFTWTQADLAQLLRICRIADLESQALDDLEEHGLVQSTERLDQPSAALKVLKDLTSMRMSFERGLQLTRFTRKSRDVAPKEEPKTPGADTPVGNVVELLKAKG